MESPECGSIDVGDGYFNERNYKTSKMALLLDRTFMRETVQNSRKNSLKSFVFRCIIIYYCTYFQHLGTNYLVVAVRLDKNLGDFLIFTLFDGPVRSFDIPVFVHESCRPLQSGISAMLNVE